MHVFTRRDLFGGALAGVATAALSRAGSASVVSGRPWDVVDTNVSLFRWPFRRLPYDTFDAFVEKLTSLSIRQAWAGSYEGLLHSDLAAVNSRLADACLKHGQELLLPFGSVNPTLPAWEEDLRRCHELHRMPGIRLHPNYHGYSLDDPQLARLLAMASERGLLVQLAASMEDRRTQHVQMQVPDVDLAPLPELIRKIPHARVHVLNYKPSRGIPRPLADAPGVYFDMARVEGTDGVARLIRSLPSDRVTFGSHAPFFVYESALIKVYESELTESESHGLFEGNAGRLLAATTR